MHQIHATQTASISELKKNPSKLISNAKGKPVAILNHNIAAAYLIPTKTYEKILELLDERDLIDLVFTRLNDNTRSIKVDLNDL